MENSIRMPGLFLAYITQLLTLSLNLPFYFTSVNSLLLPSKSLFDSESTWHMPKTIKSPNQNKPPDKLPEIMVIEVTTTEAPKSRKPTNNSLEEPVFPDAVMNSLGLNERIVLVRRMLTRMIQHSL